MERECRCRYRENSRERRAGTRSAGLECPTGGRSLSSSIGGSATEWNFLSVVCWRKSVAGATPSAPSSRSINRSMWPTAIRSAGSKGERY